MAINDQSRVMFDGNHNEVLSKNGTYSLVTSAMSFERFVSANMLAGRIIQMNSTSIYGVHLVSPVQSGGQTNTFAWPNVFAGNGQIVRIEEMIYPQGDIKNYGLDVLLNAPPPPPPPPPPPSSLPELPPIKVTEIPENITITDPADDETVSETKDVVVVATSAPYVTAADGVSHPLALVAHALYGFKDEVGKFVPTRLLPVFKQSYTEELQLRKYKFLFKRTQHDFDAHERCWLGVVATSLFGFVVRKGGKPRFPYAAQLIRLKKL